MRAKFSIGQRVRLVGGLDSLYVTSNGYSVPQGAIGTISMSLDWEGDYEVMFDGFPCPTLNDPSWFVQEAYLEPVYDGYKKSSWEECAWKPKELINGT